MNTISDLFSLKGKVAWVTGGTKGLGFEMAGVLASAGADILITSRHGEESEKAAKKIGESCGRRFLGLKADVTSEEEVASAVERAEGILGKIDILINNAGINVRQPTCELSLADWQRVIDINLTGPFICSKAVLPGMIKRKWGRVINMSSILGQVGLASRPPYTASKGGLILLTRTQALETAGTGVTVNALCPGPFATEMNQSLVNDPEKYQAFVAKIPMGRWGEMDELNGAVIYLASPASSFMTGSTLTVDGGWTAQ